MVAAQAVDCLQVDVTRCGGITEWLRVAAVAAAHGLEVSGHCAPNLHAHVAAAVPNLRHLEYFHDHARIEAMLFDGALDPSGGVLRPDPRAQASAWPSRTPTAPATASPELPEGCRGQVGPDDLPVRQPFDGPPAGEL